jgi:hypothetical protein
MEREGLRPEQVDSVRGLADRQLRVPNDPLDPRNRRVSILVKSPLLKQAHDAAAVAPGGPTTGVGPKAETAGAHDVK